MINPDVIGRRLGPEEAWIVTLRRQVRRDVLGREQEEAVDGHRSSGKSIHRFPGE